MYDVRNNLGNEVSSQLTKHFGEKVLRSIIPRNIRLAEAPSHGKPINLYDRESRGAIAYLGLAGEMLRRERSPLRRRSRVFETRPPRPLAAFAITHERKKGTTIHGGQEARTRTRARSIARRRCRDRRRRSDADGELRTLAIETIQPGRYQPRHAMDPERLDELAASIRAQGVIQPIVVREIAQRPL